MPDAPYLPPHGPIRILHQDADLLVADKPQGLLSVPGKAAGGAECLLARLEEMVPGTRLVHRLDRDTSGVMVFARHARAQRHLGLQFERRHAEKGYVALVHGAPSDSSGEIDLPLTADWPNRPRQKVCHYSGKVARTAWQVIGRHPLGVRLELRPETGRSHQLRVHLAEIGHPILGDPLYGPSGGRDARRMMLHAARLGLRHPTGGAAVAYTSPAPF
ncbi:MAG: RluA family pseudouridine synthase [Pseudomonadota bacterium]